MTNRTDPDAREARPAAPRVLRTVIEIAAPPSEVFEALTDPRELATWWGGDGARPLDCESDVRPGGTWRVRTVGADGAEHTVGGEYQVVDAPHRLEQTWQADDDAGASLVRYDLEPCEVDGAGGTRLTVTHTAPTALMAAGPRYEPVWAHGPHRVAWASRSRAHTLPRSRALT